MIDMDLQTYAMMMAVFVCALAYVVTLFMTFRDLRIFRRTGFKSYRTGALKGIVAAIFCLIGIIVLAATGAQGMMFALLFVFIGSVINKRGPRENVFTTAGTVDRLLGKTDIVRTDFEKEE